MCAWNCSAQNMGIYLPVSRNEESHTSHSDARWLQRWLDRIRIGRTWLPEDDNISRRSAGSLDRGAMNMRAKLARNRRACLVNHSENSVQYPNPSAIHIIKAITDEPAQRLRNARWVAVHKFFFPGSSHLPSRSCA